MLYTINKPLILAAKSITPTEDKKQIMKEYVSKEIAVELLNILKETKESLLHIQKMSNVHSTKLNLANSIGKISKAITNAEK